MVPQLKNLKTAEFEGGHAVKNIISLQNLSASFQASIPSYFLYFTGERFNMDILNETQENSLSLLVSEPDISEIISSSDSKNRLQALFSRAFILAGDL